METGLVSATASADQQKVIKDPPEQNAYINASNTPDFLDKASAFSRMKSGVAEILYGGAGFAH
jgi:hypothetical protein